MKKRLLSLLLVCGIVFSLIPTTAFAEENQNPFKDVKETDWFYDEVMYAFDKGLVVGVGNGKFAPDGNTTRAEAVEILYRLSGTPTVWNTVSFDDVKMGSWYADAVVWAAQNGIVLGYNATTFGPEDTITREQMATILYRYAVYNDYDVSGSADLATFTDSNRISSFAKDAMAWANAMGFINGVGNASIVPDGLVTRAQIATILTRFSIVYVDEHADTTDTDGDGLYDYLELFYGTDLRIADTDNDGLSDYTEVQIGTSPTAFDTDGNGISDYDEDTDGDGLTNGYEIELGTSPISTDSDFDDLSDENEVNIYHTNPLLADTDGDKANDGWEVENGFNPAAYNSSFSVNLVAPNTSVDMPVTAGVSTSLDGASASSLEVKPVGIAENPLLSSNMAGYLGTAYSFDVDKLTNGATITFNYDSSLGKIGEDFQPRIYYFDEDKGTLEELPNQTITNGAVSARVSHFSTYVLLNKVVFDAVWETEIRPPLSDSEDTEDVTLDIVFVIDYSNSMVDNDPNEVHKQVSKDFVAKLRDGKDRAAVVEFIKRATVLADLTTDKLTLNRAIDSIVYNNGYGTYAGTNGSAGLKSALDVLDGSNATYKYIVFITDGEDTYTSYSYDSLIKAAAEAGVTIYTVGMGSSSVATLQSIANGTGGKFYRATTTTEADDIIDLNKVFKEIQSETVDYTTDTNNDGIPDYYNDLIFSGELVLSNGSNEFEGRDFNYDINGNLSADFDGDGLKNGQELRVVQDGNRVYLKMYSDPMMVHSDADGVDDYQEHQRGSDPLRADFDGNSVGMLTRTDYLYYNQIVDLYNSDGVFRFEQALFGRGLTDGFEKIARNQIIDYFYNYASDEYWESHAAQTVAMTVTEKSNDIIKGLLGYIKDIKTASKIYGTISELEALESINNAANIIAEYKSIGSDLYSYATYSAEWYEQGVIEAMQQLLETEYARAIGEVMELSTGEEILGNVFLTINDINSKYKAFMDKKIISDLSISDTITLVKFGTDVADEIVTFSRINAASELFERNLDVLIAIRDNAKYDDVSKAAQSVIDAMGQGMSSYYQEVAEAVTDVSVDTLADELIGTALKENPVYKGYKLAMAILGIAGAKDTVKNVYAILCYSDMINAVDKLCLDALGKEYNSQSYYFYSTDDEDVAAVTRYLTHAAQLGILAEEVYISLSNTDEAHDSYAHDNIVGIIGWAKKLDLPLAKSLVEKYQ